MFSITGLLKGTAAVSAVAIAFCLIATSASAAPKKVIRDGKLADAEYVSTTVNMSSAKAKPRQVRIVVKHYVVHPDTAIPRKRGK